MRHVTLEEMQRKADQISDIICGLRENDIEAIFNVAKSVAYHKATNTKYSETHGVPEDDKNNESRNRNRL